MKLTISTPDSLGIIAGSLCMLHCMATPFLFVLMAGLSGTEAAAGWWISFNYFFLLIAFFAVYRSVKTTSRSFMKPLFLISWVALAFVMINEQFVWLELAELFSYLMALLLIALHLYNRKYCRCSSYSCCATSN